MKYLLLFALVGCAGAAPDAAALTKTGGDLTYCDVVGFDAKTKAGGGSAGNAAGWAAYDACVREKGLR